MVKHTSIILQHFTPCSIASSVNFEQVNDGWLTLLLFVNFEHISHLTLLFLLLTLSR